MESLRWGMYTLSGIPNAEDKIRRVCLETGNAQKLATILSTRSDIDCNSLTFDGLNPLQLCCLHGHSSCVETLIVSFEADVNVTREEDGAKVSTYLSVVNEIRSIIS